MMPKLFNTALRSIVKLFARKFPETGTSMNCPLCFNRQRAWLDVVRRDRQLCAVRSCGELGGSYLEK